jgi:hypothetical protein
LSRIFSHSYVFSCVAVVVAVVMCARSRAIVPLDPHCDRVPPVSERRRPRELPRFRASSSVHSVVIEEAFVFFFRAGHTKLVSHSNLGARFSYTSTNKYSPRQIYLLNANHFG